MNPEWFGDSFDIVKRYFIGVVKGQGYSVFVDPMFTGDGKGIEESFHRFVGAPKFDGKKSPGEKTALLLDPDTGIGKRKTGQHVTIDDCIRELEHHDLVIVFDQSFARNRTARVQMVEKLNLLSDRGVFGFYYDSHARFLFIGKTWTEVGIAFQAIETSGLPKSRL